MNEETYWVPILPPPPPSPPKKRRGWVLLPVMIVIVLLLIGIDVGYLFYQNGIHKRVQVQRTPGKPTSIQQPTRTPTVKPYTAQDILNTMIAHNLLVGNPQYGLPLSYFYNGGPYDDAISIPFQSSVIWQTTPYPGDCYESCAGLWVYSSYGIASTVTHELVADVAQAAQTPINGPTRYPSVVVYGRCVADWAGGTTYATIIQQYCT